MVPREEFDRGQIGEMAADRLLHIDLAPAGPLLGIGLGAMEVRAGIGRLDLGERAAPARRRGGRRRPAPARARARSAWRTGSGRPSTSGPAAMIARYIASDSGRRPSLSSSVRLHQDGGNIIGIDRQRAIEAVHAALQVAGQLEGLEEVEPDRRRARLGRRRAFEIVDRAARHRRR